MKKYIFKLVYMIDCNVSHVTIIYLIYVINYNTIYYEYSAKQTSLYSIHNIGIL